MPVPDVGVFSLGEDRRELMATVDRLSAKHCTPAVVAGTDPSGVETFWAALAEIGVLGLGTDEGGGTVLDAVAVLLRFGAAWAPGPLAATLAIPPSLPAAAQREIACGDRWVSVGQGGRFAHPAPHAIYVELAPAPRLLEAPHATAVDAPLAADWARVQGRLGPALADGDLALARLEVLAAAYLVGACDRMIRLAADYSATRVQFGRPIAANQAVSHPLAQCVNAAFAAEALTCAAATRLETDPTARADTSAAYVAAVDLATMVRRAMPQVYGAIGVSSEGPIAAMLLKLAFAGVAPAVGAARERIAAAVLDGPAVAALPVDLRPPPEVERFRAEVAAFADEHDDVHGYVRDEYTRAAVKKTIQELGRRGWLSLSWPVEHGGAGESLLHEVALWDELARADVTRPPTGLGVVAKAIMEHGSAAQCEEFLPRLRAGDIDIALGYSEPEAGSDLTSLRTRARRVEGGYLVNGEKRWTSNGHVADYLWLLVRTGTPESRGKGLSLLLVDAGSPGITVSPVPMIDGARLNEIHFQDVFVPESRRVGQENAAWQIISSSLAVERYVQMPPGRVTADFLALCAWLKAQGAEHDPLVRARLAGLAVEVAKVGVAANAAVLAQESGQPTAAAATHAKLLHSLTAQAIADAGLELGGPAAVDSTAVQATWLQSFGETLGGGSTEVLRTSLAKLEFGLPAR